jgi:ABC-type branched-subunit amino acid transport system substrate-binding protein
VKKILFISVAMVLALGMSLIGCTAGPGEEEIPIQPDQIVIGVSSPLDGPLAPIRASALSPVLAVYLQELNDAGGIHLKEYDRPGVEVRVPVVVKEYNDSSGVDTMLENTEKLITVDKVDFMFGACGTAMIAAQAPLVNSLGHVLLTFEGGATTMKETLPGMPYVFVNLSFSDWYEMPVLAKMLGDAGATTAYVVWINDLHGVEYNAISNIYFDDEGITISKSVSISGVPSEAAAQAPGIIADAKAVNADVFCMFAYPDQIMPLTGQAIAQGFNPKAMIGGPGVNFGFYGLAFGPLSEGILCFAVANVKTSSAMETMFDKLEAYWDAAGAHMSPPLPGFYFMDFWGAPIYWSVMQIWQAAVEQVGYVNQDLLKDALKSGEFNTIMSSKTKYTMFGTGGGFLDYKAHTGEIGQWQNGYVEVVGYDGIKSDLPNYKVTADFIYPKPAFPTG